MNVLDSSGWIELFTDSPNADQFAPVVEDLTTLIVPSITLFEVFKWFEANLNEHDALQAVAHMGQGQVIDLDSNLAVSGAHVSLLLDLPMADSIILATARLYQATLWTQDSDFDGLEGVNYIEKKTRS
ncbi:MAG: hypothetical protein BMS9Abin05_0475 [Rhodothermia bacterium]|nr:MAG: hypothetical protein BMS9Abin05_0475 [Rhodothermia bacterium]